MPPRRSSRPSGASRRSPAAGAGGRAERVAGRLHATLDYGQVDEILSDDPQHYVDGIVRYCSQIHAALYQSYMAYPVDAALPA